MHLQSAALNNIPTMSQINVLCVIIVHIFVEKHNRITEVIKVFFNSITQVWKFKQVGLNRSEDGENKEDNCNCD